MNNKDNLNKWLINKNLFKNEVILVGILLLLIVFFSLLNKNFYTLNNLKTISINMGRGGFIVIGMCLILITGNIDLSVGSMVGLASTVAALVFTRPFFSEGIVNSLIGILIVIIAGGILGSFNGVFVVNLGINTIITTLATMAIFRGLSYAFLGGKVLYIKSPLFLTIARSNLGGVISFPFIILIIFFFILFLFLTYTKFGNNFKATGADEKIAYTFGIKVKKIKFIAFVVSGIMAGITSIIICGQIGAGAPEYGIGMELDAIIITVLGGVRLRGGRGNASGLFIALTILEVFTIGFVILGLSLYLRYIARGLILIIVLIIDVIRDRRQLQLG